MKITEKQRAVLLFLSKQPHAIPQEIGAAAGGTKRNIPQGLGRIGGAMAHRLIKKGLVEDASFLRSGFPAYRITGAGRQMLLCT